MDALIEAIKFAGGTVELISINDNGTMSDAILNVWIDNKEFTLFVVTSASHCAMSVAEFQPHETFRRPMGVLPC